ncbi:MAG: 23S rRNA (uracil(1939)-C(5))-methyltransferase RlmD, partial [Bacteroidales bacterium]|nr:23S rRNA (uracil(1939)-C(5))-methyltransferase RlmD [Bacteroidales bacterium]
MSRKRVDLVLEGVVIEGVAAEGKAIAHAGDGMVVFVDFAVPGDVVDVRVLKKKKSYMEGRVVRIVSPSEHRVEPFCPHFGVCGGCRWQPLPYSMQLDAKRQQVYDQLVRIGHLEVPEINPTLPSPVTEFYRNKLEFSASSRRWVLAGEDPEAIPESDRMGLGFHVGKFFDKILDIRDCHLQPEPSNAIRLEVKKFCVVHGYEFYNVRENRGYFRGMFVRTASGGQVMVILCFAYEDLKRRTALMDHIAEKFPEITSMYYVINGKMNDSISDQDCVLYRGEEAIYEEMEGLRFKIGPKSFYQTNSVQAYNLYKVAREFAGLTGSEVVYDLYTGTGTIAQFVSARAKKVVGIEYVPEAIEDAKVNASVNGIDNCKFY